MKNMEEMMADLKSKTGHDFDQAFLEAMIIHHQQAVRMSDDALDKAEDEEVRELAKNINVSQQEEIEKMKQMKENG